MSIAMFEKPEPETVVAHRIDNGERMVFSRRTASFLGSSVLEFQSEDAWWIAPPLFDIQVNGFAGVDFQDDGLTVDELMRAVQGLEKAGCSRFLFTLVTDHWEKILTKMSRILQWRSEHPILNQAIAGWHIEGPFLSSQPGFHGAHDPALMLDPTVSRIRDLRQAAGDLPLLLTLAPERPGSLEAIAEAVRLGIKVSAGHTNATSSQLSAAHQAGLQFFTHLGNAIPRELDRHDNILWRVLDHGGLKISLIPDSIHVSPQLFRLIHRCVPVTQIAFTTDAMSAAGAPPGRYKLAGMELEVGPDLVVRQPGRSNFAGSALTPVEGVRRAASMLGCSWQETWERFSSLPANWMEIQSEFNPGEGSDFCLIQTDASNEILGVECIRSRSKRD